MILLSTADGKMFRVAEEFVSQLVTIGNMVADMGAADDDTIPIPLPNVNANILQLVLQYIEYHWSNPLPFYYFPPDKTKNPAEPTPDQQKPTPSSSSNNKKKSKEEEYDYHRSDDVVEWDKHFIGQMPQHVMFEVILACNFLDYKPLLDACCKTIAEKIKTIGNPEDIRKHFNIKNDFTPEEEEQMIRENEWVNEK